MTTYIITFENAKGKEKKTIFKYYGKDQSQEANEASFLKKHKDVEVISIENEDETDYQKF